ncbi:MAG: hypothetical protein MTP17_01645 [Candidatus Midichloria sp.]|nr:MAG: hypothetical protein MTP17_01645 [Candidatus Midichloria sp.]
MISHVKTLYFIGVEFIEVEVQVLVCSGIAAFNIIGMPNKAINELKERIRAAFGSIEPSILMKRVTVNLSPADLLKKVTTLIWLLLLVC